MTRDYDECEKYLNLIKDDPIKLWDYINSVKAGSIEWIMTRHYRVQRAHQQEEARKREEIENFSAMNNRVKIIKDGGKEY